MSVKIRNETANRCPICGCAGDYFFLDMKDTLFGVPGFWNFRRCADAACRHMWLDPRPLSDDLGLCYNNYYTHVEPENIDHDKMRSAKGFRKFYYACKHAYWTREYGYPEKYFIPFCKVFVLLFYVWYRRNLNVDTDVRFLKYVPGGKLLDIGCGNGSWIEFASTFGWNALGIDFDGQATALARQKGLNVTTGDLRDAGYHKAEFDAVTMVHVVEHLNDVKGYLKECNRILKPGGKLVIITPNSESFGRCYFKKNWRGLEPPRHLHIFSTSSLCKVLALNGFSQYHCRYIYGPHILYASQVIKKNLPAVKRNASLKSLDIFIIKVLQLIELGLMMFRRKFGEILVVEVYKV